MTFLVPERLSPLIADVRSLCALTPTPPPHLHKVRITSFPAERCHISLFHINFPIISSQTRRVPATSSTLAGVRRRDKNSLSARGWPRAFFPAGTTLPDRAGKARLDVFLLGIWGSFKDDLASARVLHGSANFPW